MSPIHYSLQCRMCFVSPYSAQSQWGKCCIKIKNSKYNIVMCNKEVHELLIQESHINGIFCNNRSRTLVSLCDIFVAIL